jgi:hypothetical protein
MDLQMNKSSEPDNSQQKKKNFDYAWQFESGNEISINYEKYRNELIEIYGCKTESKNSSLVVNENCDYMH